MRRIKVGDKVQAFLDVSIVGTVIKIEESKNVPWMVGGTISTESICVLQLTDDRKVRYKMSDLHHYDV